MLSVLTTFSVTYTKGFSVLMWIFSVIWTSNLKESTAPSSLVRMWNGNMDSRHKSCVFSTESRREVRTKALSLSSLKTSREDNLNHRAHLSSCNLSLILKPRTLSPAYNSCWVPACCPQLQLWSQPQFPESRFEKLVKRISYGFLWHTLKVCHKPTIPNLFSMNKCCLKFLCQSKSFL